ARRPEARPALTGGIGRGGPRGDRPVRGDARPLTAVLLVERVREEALRVRGALRGEEGVDLGVRLAELFGRVVELVREVERAAAALREVDDVALERGLLRLALRREVLVVVEDERRRVLLRVRERRLVVLRDVAERAVERRHAVLLLD